MPLSMEVGLSPGDFCLIGTEPPPQKGGHIYCSQAAGWTKMTLGTEVGLCPDDIVLDGDPAPLPQKGG